MSLKYLLNNIPSPILTIKLHKLKDVYKFKGSDFGKIEKKRKEEIIRCAKKLVNKVSSNITEILVYSLYTQFYIIRLFKKREKKPEK